MPIAFYQAVGNRIFFGFCTAGALACASGEIAPGESFDEEGGNDTENATSDLVVVDDNTDAQSENNDVEEKAVSVCGNEGMDSLWRFVHRQPLDEPPPGPAANWPRYTDTSYPTIGFLYPPDWSATSLSTTSSSGVRIDSESGDARLVLYQVYLPQDVETAEDMIRAGLSQLLDVTSSGAEACAEPGFSENGFGGLTGSYRIQGLAADDDSLVFAVSEVYVDDGRFGFGEGIVVTATFNAVRAPRSSFASTTQNSFLPILSQLPL